MLHRSIPQPSFVYPARVYFDTSVSRSFIGFSPSGPTLTVSGSGYITPTLLLFLSLSPAHFRTRELILDCYHWFALNLFHLSLSSYHWPFYLRFVVAHFADTLVCNIPRMILVSENFGAVSVSWRRCYERWKVNISEGKIHGSTSAVDVDRITSILHTEWPECSIYK
jgi:hypothetical protein